MMRRHALRLVLVTMSVPVLISTPATVGVLRAAQAPTLDEVLRRAGEYVDQYERALSAVGAEEDYLQVVFGPASRLSMANRKTRAYVLVLDMGRFGWVSFRDVFEVDGRPVREREDRLSRLLTQLNPDSLEQGRRIATESARFNLNPPGVNISRTINTPMTALLFLRPYTQARSSFRLGKTEEVDGVPCLAVSFAEQETPRIIRTGDDAAAKGTFWIDMAHGRILRTELQLETSLRRELAVHSEIKVKYGHFPKLDLWLPETMDEFYEVRPGRQVITAHARYSDYRQFKVTTDEDIK